MRTSPRVGMGNNGTDLKGNKIFVICGDGRDFVKCRDSK